MRYDGPLLRGPVDPRLRSVAAVVLAREPAAESVLLPGPAAELPSLARLIDTWRKRESRRHCRYRRRAVAAGAVVADLVVAGAVVVDCALRSRWPRRRRCPRGVGALSAVACVVVGAVALVAVGAVVVLVAPVAGAPVGVVEFAVVAAGVVVGVAVGVAVVGAVRARAGLVAALGEMCAVSYRRTDC